MVTVLIGQPTSSALLCAHLKRAHCPFSESLFRGDWGYVSSFLSWGTKGCQQSPRDDLGRPFSSGAMMRATDQWTPWRGPGKLTTCHMAEMGLLQGFF